jgi:erythronate-4-phosphate dehydrogenase
MKIVADENIPLLEHYFGAQGQLVCKPGREITRNDLLDADILLVRSVTTVNQALLKGTRVKFVGSATIGADHLDTAWLDLAGIEWYVAVGCNGTAVVEYVIAVLAALQKQKLLAGPNLRAGVIGVGAIGSRVAEKLSALGFSVLLCDPFRLLHEKNFPGVFLEDFVDLDLITLHTPLTYHGAYPTYHLIEKEFLQRQKPGCVLLNTGRGPVINFKQLKKYGEALVWCLDVWEQEPQIDLTVLQRALIATPHIAGYSVQSKYRGIKMVYEAALRHGVIAGPAVAPVNYPEKTLSLNGATVDWREAVLQIYDPMVTTQQMKQRVSKNIKEFDVMRKDFLERHELQFITLVDARLEQQDRDFLVKLKG